MHWFCYEIDTTIFWPTTETEVVYKGNKFILFPKTENGSPCVSVCCSDWHHAQLIVNRFISALAWVEGEGICIKSVSQYMGTKPSNPNIKVTRMANDFRKDYLPDTNDEKALRALALYREGISSNSIAGQFLGCYKVINVVYNKSDDQIAWINDSISKLKTFGSLRRIEIIKGALNDKCKTIGDYLYVQGRCAVAHAFSEPVIDPDNPSDIIRLESDFDVIKELAQLIIEEKLGVIRHETYRKLHLYELNGFASLFGADTIDKLKNGIKLETKLEIPNIAIRIRDKNQILAFANIKVVALDQKETDLILYCEANAFIRLVIILDFKEWRLSFDPLDCVGFTDDGSLESIGAYIDYIKLTKEIYGNGEIEIIRCDTKSLLARTDPFIPTNILVGHLYKQLDMDIEKANEEYENRCSKIVDK